MEQSSFSEVSSSLISRLRKIASKESLKEDEQCAFCGKILAEEHRHLLETASTNFACACEVCLLLQAENPQYKIIPDRYIRLENFNMPESLWNNFLIPVNIAFFVNSSVKNGIVAYYPAAAGATESKLKMEPWKMLEELNPSFQLTEDVSALIVNKLDSEPQYYLIPIDSCYRLIGMIRTSWQGISGGNPGV